MRAEKLPVPELPATPELLVSGGDGRIAPGSDGRNKYGCLPYPEPDLMALGSSTATGISEAGYASADSLRNRLAQALAAEPTSVIHARETERIRQELAGLCGLPKRPGTSLMLAASGTAAHQLAVRLTGNVAAQPLSVLMVEAAESGSGVPAALADGKRHTVNTVPLRHADGTPRLPEEVDADFTRLARETSAQGMRVLLVLCDVSKTGLVAPSPACAEALLQEGKVHVLVDACQFRLSLPSLHAYLDRNFMVALTGSKFLTGPSFSGALLVPESLSPPVPAGQGNEINWGLLLRWEAALHELRIFQALPETRVQEFLSEFARTVNNRLAVDPAFEILPTPGLDRGPQSGAASWDGQQTIFPFLLMHPQSHMPLSREQTAQAYRLLQTSLSALAGFSPSGPAALRCQLGQPVACGERSGIAVSALRICASSRMAADAAERGNRVVIEQALSALDKAAMVIKHASVAA